MTNLDLPNALLGAAAGLLIQGLIVLTIAIRQYTRREFSGRIYAILPPSGGKEERWDVMRIRQAGQRLTGSIKRVKPDTERGCKWKFIGYSHGNTIVSVFFTTDPRRDSSSYGVMVMHRNPEIKDRAVWQGYYVRPDLHGLESIKNSDVARYPLIWQKQDPHVRNYATQLSPKNIN